MVIPGYQFWDVYFNIPCWLGWMVWVPLSTAFLPITTIRATLLLCQFEVTADLYAAEQIRAVQRQKYKQQQRQNFMRQNSGHIGNDRDRGGNGGHNGNASHRDHSNITLTARTPNDSPTASALPHHHHANNGNGTNNNNSGIGTGSLRNSGLDGTITPPMWRPSWWTLNRHYLRGKLLSRLVFLLIFYYILCDLAVVNLVTSPTLRCAADISLKRVRDILLICTSAVSAPLCIWLFIVVYNLRRHQRDGYVRAFCCAIVTTD